MDLLIGEPDAAGNPDLKKVRICIENKSVITAHRNRDARFDDLYEVLQDLHGIKSEIIMGATVMVGTGGAGAECSRWRQIPFQEKGQRV